MYYNTVVKVPKVEGKIVRKQKGNSVYILLEVGRIYNSARKYNVPQRVIIGKQVADGDSGSMYPNDNFLKFFPEIPVTVLEDPRIRSNTLRAGTFIVLSQIIKEYKLDDLLHIVFQDQTGFILDLASYMIVCEDNVAQHYPDYARSHPLFTKDMDVLSDSTISRFLSSIEQDQITNFLDLWNEGRDHRQRIYVTYDSTNKNNQAGDLDFAEFGHAKVDLGTPIINIALAYDKTNRVPLFYEEYPGSINDVSQLKYMIDKVSAYHYRSIGFIIDRGYFSKSNIEYMDEQGYPFLLMVKGCKPLVSTLIEECLGTFEAVRACHVSGSSVYGITIERELFPKDKKSRFFHLCYSPFKMSREREYLELKLERMAKELKKMEGMEIGEIGKPYTDYFTCHYVEEEDKKRFLFAEENEEIISRELRLCGYFCLVSSEKMSAEDAYHLYKGRDISEKLFCSDKTFLGSRSVRVHSNEAASAKIFIEFIGLIIRNRFYNLLKDEMRRLKVRKNYMTVPAAIKELEKVEMTRRSGSVYQQDFALTKNQKCIFNAFGISESDVTTQIHSIAQQLKELDEDVLTDDEDDENAETEIDDFD